MAAACGLWILLLSSVAEGDENRVGPYWDTSLFYGAVADTDSVALWGVDSLRAFINALGADSLRALLTSLNAGDEIWQLVDSIAPIDTFYRAQKYVGIFSRDRRASPLFPREHRPLQARPIVAWKHNIILDTTATYYIARETVAGRDVRHPVRLDRSTYRTKKLRSSLDRNWRALISQRAARRAQQRRGGLGLSITVPGGSQSGFTTIFGKNEVDLNVTGTADIRAGIDYRQSEQQITFGQRARIDPDFKQELRLGVTGTIGDKMQVAVNWDSERQFDYQNQLKLEYTGYEDEIIKSIEAGNVILRTPSSLIRGGQSLFGIKTELKLGSLQLTTVASQQEGQSNSLQLEGGAELSQFSQQSTGYVDRTLYFLSYYFRNRWEEALGDPPNIILDAVFSGITDIEVWKLTPVSPEEQNVRQVVAMVDLGEPQQLVTQADAYTQAMRPSGDIDQYDDAELASELRPGSAVPKDYLESDAMDQPLKAVDFQVGQFKKLIPGSDYDLDELLGYITLTQRIQESEALAVSFRYLAGGEEVQVGDFSSETGGGDNSQTGERIVLKLLKPVNLQQPANIGQPGQLNPAAWYLEMRNVYRLGRGLRPSEFILDIGYEPPGRSSERTLPGITGQATLIQVLGLDRLNEDGATKPDNLFDFLPNFTVDPGNGLLFFPYLEPFGSRIEDLITASGLPEEEKDLARSQLVFSDLYRKKKVNAARNTQLDVYQITGSFKGGIPSFYDLRAFSGLVEGSVRVTSGGVGLTEGTDFIVDYNGGTVTIVNPAYLTTGRDIAIDYEQNALINLQKKTLLGARIDWSNSERYALGGTAMRISQKSITDKFRVGDEPIANFIWGFDGQLDLQPRWLTRAVDALPLIQTKEPSLIQLSAEVAQLRPGHTLTSAFKDERRDLRRNGRDFYPDEVGGISYVDDFEGFENVFTLNRPGAWLLSSAPVLGEEKDVLGDGTPMRNSERSAIGWYQINAQTLEHLGSPTNLAVQLIAPQSVFPNRQVSSQERVLTTLDVFFTPHERGPYNYNMDLGGFLDNPRSAWAGMTQRLTEGNTDFTSKNIEFIEFIFQPFPEAGDIDPEARLIIDLGLISEDVIPDNKLNTEDGLSLTEGGPVGQLARLSTGQQDQVINPINENDRITEDLGLDGLASFPDNKFEREGGLGTERTKFAEFVASLDATQSTLHSRQLELEKAKARRDPSGDDYHYFLDDAYFNNSQYYLGGASVQQRFTHFFSGHELNSFEGQRKLGDAANPVGNSRIPDSEDINLNSAPDTENSYFQYELPLSLAQLDELARPEMTHDYVVGEIKTNDGAGTGWYLVRIPVKQYTRRVGGIQDFTLIESIRVWTTGHTAPVTLRFATLEFVGSQWRKSTAVSARSTNDEMLPPDDPLTGPSISIASVNNEENAHYAIPNGTVRDRLRERQSGAQREAREQAMVLHVENVEPDRQQAIYYTYSSPEDLLRYSNLRMFLHLDGFIDGLPITEEDRGELTFFMRLGANEVNDYYEFEQPLTASPLDQLPSDGIAKADYLWRTNQPNPDPTGVATVDLNSVNIELSVLNQLKFLRDEYRDAEGVPFDPSVTFWHDERAVLVDQVAAFAAPGARIGVKGTPSLARVSTLVMGVRNKSVKGGILTDVNVWVNELRVSGYDEKAGLSALANAQINLADFARVKATARMQTDGFGGLESSLSDRSQINVRDWAVNTQISVDKFIPERFGWALPVTMEIKSSESSPRFDPNRGDIRVASLLDAIAADTTLSGEEIAVHQQAVEEASQTLRETRSLSTRVSKSGSRSRLVRNTLDGLNFSYSLSDQTGRSPSRAFQDRKRWNSTLSYRLGVRGARVLRPFWFLDNVPVARILGEIQWNYLPNSFSYSLSANRNFSRSKRRPDPVRRSSSNLPIDVEYPVRPQHRFSHSRQFSFQYEPFGFLSLGLNTMTDQSLNEIGADTLYSVILVDPLGQETLYEDTRLRTLIDAGITDETQIGKTAFELEDLAVVPFRSVVSSAFNSEVGPSVRTDDYQSQANVSFRPRLHRYRSMSWLQIQDVSYNATFRWRNGSVGNNTGANASTDVTMRAGLSVGPQELFEIVGLYGKLLEAQRAAEEASEIKREQRRLEREARRAQRQADQERRRGEEEEDVEEGEYMEEEEGEYMEEEEGEYMEEEEGEYVEEEEPVREETEGTRFRIPLLSTPLPALRRLALAVMQVQDVAVTYMGTRRSEASNVGRVDENGEVIVDYGLRDALFYGQGPSLWYRFGLERTIDAATDRIINERLQVTDALTDGERYQARMTWNPTRNLRINLNWSLESTRQQGLTYRVQEDGTPYADSTRIGDNGLTVWAFGASYLDLFNAHLDRFNADCGPDCFEPESVQPDTIHTATLTNEGIYRDFLDNYLGGPVGVVGGGRTGIPLPTWQINYSGLSTWPFFRWIAQSLTLRHSYAANLSTDFRSNLRGGESEFFQLGAQTIAFVLPKTAVDAARINERYQPLLGVDLSLKGSVQTSINWNKSNSYALSTTNMVVGHTHTNEVSVSASYSRQGMRLPFIRKRLNNRISLAVTMSRSVEHNLNLNIRRAIEAAIAEPEFDPVEVLEDPYANVLTNTQRLRAQPKITYQFSNQVTADAFMEYERFVGDSRRPSMTSIKAGFNFRVNFSQ